MDFLKDTAFVVRRINSGEKDRFITLFTKEHGKIEVFAKGVRALTSRRSPSLEPLNLIHFQAVRSHTNYVLTEVQLINSATILKENLENLKLAFLVCELIDKLTRSWQKHEDVFLLMEQVLTACEGGVKHDLFREFQVQMLSALGFWDDRKAFIDDHDLAQYVDQIAERKIQSREFFNE